MANEAIGRAPCPLCALPARVTVSKAGLTVLTCNRCNCQLFTRSDQSDERLRRRLLPDEVPPAVDPAPVPEPAALPVDNMPPPAAAPKKSTWDIWG